LLFFTFDIFTITSKKMKNVLKMNTDKKITLKNKEKEEEEEEKFLLIFFFSTLTTIITLHKRKIYP